MSRSGGCSVLVLGKLPFWRCMGVGVADSAGVRWGVCQWVAVVQWVGFGRLGALGQGRGLVVAVAVCWVRSMVLVGGEMAVSGFVAVLCCLGCFARWGQVVVSLMRGSG